MLRYDIQIATGKVCFQNPYLPDDPWNSVSDLSTEAGRRAAWKKKQEQNNNSTVANQGSSAFMAGRAMDDPYYSKSSAITDTGYLPGISSPDPNISADPSKMNYSATLSQNQSGDWGHSNIVPPVKGRDNWVDESDHGDDSYLDFDSWTHAADPGTISPTYTVDDFFTDADDHSTPDSYYTGAPSMLGAGTFGALEHVPDSTPIDSPSNPVGGAATTVAPSATFTGDEYDPIPEKKPAKKVDKTDLQEDDSKVTGQADTTGQGGTKIEQPPRELTQAEKNAGKSWVRDDEGTWRIVSGGTSQGKAGGEGNGGQKGGGNGGRRIWSNKVDGGGYEGGDDEGGPYVKKNGKEMRGKQAQIIIGFNEFRKKYIDEHRGLAGFTEANLNMFDPDHPSFSTQHNERMMELYSESLGFDKNFYKTVMDNLELMHFGQTPEEATAAAAKARGSSPEQYQTKIAEINDLISRGIDSEDDLKKALALRGNTGEGAVHLPGGYKINDLGELVWEAQQRFQAQTVEKEDEAGNKKEVTEMVGTGELLYERMEDPNMEARLKSVYRNFTDTQDRLQTQIDSYLALRGEYAAVEPALQVTQKREEIDVAKRSQAISQARTLMEETGLVYEVKPVLSKAVARAGDVVSEGGEPTGEYEVVQATTEDGTPLTTMARDKMLGAQRPITLGEGEMVSPEELPQFAQQRLNLVSQVSQRIMPQITESLNNIDWVEALNSPQDSTELTNLRRIVTNIGGSQPSDIPGEQGTVVGELPPIPAGAVWDNTAKQYVQAEGYTGRSFDANTQKYLTKLGNIKKQRDHVAAVLASFDKNKLEHQMNLRQIEEQDARLARHLETGAIDSAQEAAIRIEESKLETIRLDNKAKQFQIYTTFLSNPVAVGMAQKFGILDNFLPDLDPELRLPPSSAPIDINIASWGQMSATDKAMYITEQILTKDAGLEEILNNIKSTAPGEALGSAGTLSYATL